MALKETMKIETLDHVKEFYAKQGFLIVNTSIPQVIGEELKAVKGACRLDDETKDLARWVVTGDSTFEEYRSQLARVELTPNELRVHPYFYRVEMHA